MIKVTKFVILVIAALVIIFGAYFVYSPEQEVPRGTVDEYLEVTIYDEEKAYEGTTFLTDSNSKRVVEINMLGEVLWEFSPLDEWDGFDQMRMVEAELLPNDNILLLLGNYGLYEIDREYNIIWSYEDSKASHDADRLENGNTLYVFGMDDTHNDAQVKEVDQDGNLVWEWYAEDTFGENENLSSIEEEGWTHINAVQRFENGNTMVSLRNFQMTAIINPNGEIVKQFNWKSLGYGNLPEPHEPVVYENEGTIMVCLQNDSTYEVLEVDLETGEEVWSYDHPTLRTARDCDLLPNGNVLITAVNMIEDTQADNDYSNDISTIIEVTPDGEVVWQLVHRLIKDGVSPGWFFKAERVDY